MTNENIIPEVFQGMLAKIGVCNFQTLNYDCYITAMLWKGEVHHYSIQYINTGIDNQSLVQFIGPDDTWGPDEIVQWIVDTANNMGEEEDVYDYKDPFVNDKDPEYYRDSADYVADEDVSKFYDNCNGDEKLADVIEYLEEIKVPWLCPHANTSACTSCAKCVESWEKATPAQRKNMAVNELVELPF